MSRAGQVYERRRLAWTEEEIIARIKLWERQHGRPPAANEWQPSDCRRFAERSSRRALAWLRRVERWEQGDWPWTGSVTKRFGSWNAAIEAAGLDPRDAHRPVELDMEVAGDLDAMRRLLKRAERSEGDQLRQVLYSIADCALVWVEQVETE